MCKKRSTQDSLCLFICRLGATGLAPVGPGTWGTLWALLFAPLFFLPLPIMGRLLCLCAIFFLGAIAATRAEKVLGRKDPGQVVIDELLGMWITFLPFTKVSISMWLMGFVLFRFFDILKPWPVKASEHWMRQGYGIMLDDAVAGILSMCCLGLLSFFALV